MQILAPTVRISPSHCHAGSTQRRFQKIFEEGPPTIAPDDAFEKMMAEAVHKTPTPTPHPHPHHKPKPSREDDGRGVQDSSPTPDPKPDPNPKPSPNPNLT